MNAKGAQNIAELTQKCAEKINFSAKSAFSQRVSARLLFASQIKGEEEGGDDVRSAWPFDTLGNTRGTMAGTEGCQVARRSQSQKTGPSSDRSLQLDSLKPDLLVIGDQNAPVNTFSDLVLTIKAPSSFLFKRVKISSSDSSSECS